ncbi:hypothetical protein Nepgr_000673 [Nepenthes gracilis]|uniref:Protein kinase domain-containing protein n=1 Tax=Nepenthes gracilis TaxID=150966 RepID=A0AAD3RWD7_NEPGR|nr:hypothetical protein Nepgr_000673 [Nepenthes gracilis]
MTPGWGAGDVREGMHSIYLLIFLLFELAFGDSDVEALLKLKKGFQKDPSGLVLHSWDLKSLASDGCPINWFGISCVDGNVESIMLNDLHLVGDLDFTSITGLKLLRNLSISNNQLSGNISGADSIGSLEYFDLSRNLFEGPVIFNLTNWRNLVLLNLSSNNFDGTVPSGFRNLGKLRYLDLHSNGFSGDIMNLIKEFGYVEEVDLSCNQFVGYFDIGLGNPSFISSIRYLNVSHNALMGEMFAHDGMPYFDSLEVFDASNNQFTGTIPSFNFVVSLRILCLRNNRLSGSIPEALLQESSMMLSELDLSINQLEGPVGSIKSASLKNLNLSSNKLSGALPLKVGHCAIVDLSNNNLSGNLSRIQHWGNYVEVIKLSSNSLTGTLPNDTSQFLRLTSFEVDNNSLDGVLPLVLGTYPELEEIDLSFNQLTGFLLPSLFNSSTLIALNLSGNNFSGPIPLKSVLKLPVDSTHSWSLVSLDLSHNSLSGHLPVEISKYHNLAHLDISNNHFEGSIPDDLPDQLTGFNVSCNNLSGIIPESLRRFPDSAFHPGNTLLLFHDSKSWPNGISSTSSREHHSHVKRAIKAFLIAGLIGTATILALLSTIIYCRTHRKGHDSKSCKGSTEKNNNKCESNSLPSTSPSHKSAGASSTALSSALGPICLPQMKAAQEPGNSSSGVAMQKDFVYPEIPMKDELSSPISFLSSSNPSPSKGQHGSESLGVLKVGSPDKLAGELNIFDSSSVFTAEQLSRAPAEVIGRSCHGTLYRAALDSGHMLVVKRLKEGIAKGRKEFAREAKKLGSIKHPNLVSLHGYYWGPKEHEKLIISTYINAPCLALYLQGSEKVNFHPCRWTNDSKSLSMWPVVWITSTMKEPYLMAISSPQTSC